MLNKTQPIETNLNITRDGQVDNSYYRKQVRKARTAAIQRYFAALGKDIALGITNRLVGAYDEAKRNIALDLMDYKYNTSLRAQYHSGRRTQQILAAKRQYGI